MKHFQTVIITVLVCFLVFIFIYDNYLKEKDAVEGVGMLEDEGPITFEEAKQRSVSGNIRLISYYHPEIVYTQYVEYYNKIFSSDIWHRNVFTVTVENRGNDYETVLIEAEIPEYSYETWEEFSIPPGSTDVVGITPELIHSNLFELREITPVPLKVRIKTVEDENEVLLIEDMFNIKLSSVNTAVFQMKNETRNVVLDLRDYVCIWVTPNSYEIQDILRTAAEFHPQKAIVGYQMVGGVNKADVVRQQVKAVYRALQSLNIAYVSNPVSIGGGQKIKFPSEVVSTQSANCIEGVVLMASALEAIGLEPLIVFTPRHAFIGWKTWKDSSECEFLETSYIWHSLGIDFEIALRKGVQQVKEEKRKGNFRNRKSKIIDVKKIHGEKGITPFSYDYY
jgi:hypothetical protein